MKLPRLAYHRATCLDHAVELLSHDPEQSRVLAGGQSLIPVMALRLANPALLVDITRCQDLNTWAAREKTLVISAAVTGRQVERSGELKKAFPLVTQALSYVGHPEIRNRGTVCGSAAHADPAAEIPALLLAMDGSVRVIGADGRRRVAARDFFVGPYMSALAPGEVLAGVEVPAVPPTAGWAIKEVARRHGDFALVGVICVVELDPTSLACATVSITLFGVSATAKRCPAAEEFLRGHEPTDGVLAEASELAFSEIEVLGDIHGSEAYRRQAGMTLARRALTDAVEMARNLVHGVGSED